MRERLGREIVEDRDALVHGVLLLPGGRLHLLEAGADDDLDIRAAKAAGGAAAVHRGVAAAEHDHALSDAVDVAERDVRQPVDADVDVGRAVLPAGHVEVAPARRAGADENRVEPLAEQRPQAVDALPVAGLDPADADDVADLLVDHLFGQAEARDLAADHAAALSFAVEQHDVVAERREVARDGERGRAGADQRDTLAVARDRRFRQGRADVVLVVGGDALQAADRDGLRLDAPAAAGRLAGPVAGAAEDARKDVGRPIDHIGVAVAARRDEPDVLGHRRVGRAGPLAIDHLVEVIRMPNVRRRHGRDGSRPLREIDAPAGTLLTLHDAARLSGRLKAPS